MTRCKIDGCDKPSRALGLCAMHRMRLKRYGDPTATKRPDWGARQSHPLYTLWLGMRRRCRDPKEKNFKNYGGRGIKVCEQWEDFATFVRGMGERPSSKHSIHRLDNDGNYEPSNCRWATSAEQARHTSRSVVTAEDVIAIRALKSAGIEASRIAVIIDLHYDHVRNVIVGDSWNPALDATVPDFVPAKPLGPNGRPSSARTCEYEGCDRHHYSNGYCRKHYRWVIESVSYETRKARTCDGCGEALFDSARIDVRFCGNSCRMKWHRKEGCYAAREANPERTCSETDCNRPHHAKGVCRSHYMQLWRKASA